MQTPTDKAIDSLVNTLKAGEPLIWIETTERIRAMRLTREAVAKMLRGHLPHSDNHRLVQCDLDSGAYLADWKWTPTEKRPKCPPGAAFHIFGPDIKPDPFDTLVSMKALCPPDSGNEKNYPLFQTIILFDGLGSYLDAACESAASCGAVETILLKMAGALNQASPALSFKNTGTHLVGIGPKPKELSPALEAVITTIKLPLPSTKEIEDIIAASIEGNAEKSPARMERTSELFGEEYSKARSLAAESLVGLTEYEIEKTVFQSILISKGLDPKVLHAARAQIINNVKGLSFVEHSPEFDWKRVIGLDKAEEIVDRFLSDSIPDSIKLKSLLLLGVPGCGKTMMAYAIAQRLKRPLFTLRIDEMLGSLLGDSEANAQRALDTIDAIGKCVVVMDEADKQMSGMVSRNGSHAGNDSIERIGSKLLTWEQEKSPDALVVKTANRPDNLPAECLRPGRIDLILFVDLPNFISRTELIDQYACDNDIETSPEFRIKLAKELEGWSPQDIKDLCRKARAFLDPQTKDAPSAFASARDYTKPQWETRRQEIQKMRQEGSMIGIACCYQPLCEESSQFAISEQQSTS